jgi:hypothetical protein
MIKINNTKDKVEHLKYYDLIPRNHNILFDDVIDEIIDDWVIRIEIDTKMKYDQFN